MAKLKIYSDIVNADEKAFLSWAGMDGVSFGDIDKFVDEIADDDAIDLSINCRGGDADEALAMYDVLRASGKTISAEVIGECSSAATLLLCAARKDLRRAHPNASILIHNPYIAGYVEGDARRVGAIADSLADIRQKYLDIYVERTGAERDTLSALMDEDKPMGVTRAIELGFIAEEIPPISANRKQKYNISMTIKQRLDKAINAFRDAFSVVALTLETADGKTLEVDKESGDVAVGDVVLSGDGEYLLPDGRTVVVEEGVVTDIRPAEEMVDDPGARGEESGDGDSDSADTEETDSEKDAEIDRLRATIAEKDAEIDRLRKELEEAKADAKSESEREVLDMVATAGGVNWLKAQRSKATPAQRDTETAAMDKIDAKRSAEKLSFAEYRRRKAAKKAQK